MSKKLLTTVLASAFALSTLASVGISKKAEAVTGSDWQAGNIINDVVFTNADGMSVQQIQELLNGRVGTGGYDSVRGQCDTNGARNAQPFSSSTRAQYAASLGRPTTFTCLKDYYEVPKLTPGAGIPASNYGGTPIPAGAKSAAQLIWDAAHKHNISPQVLIIKIQTESAGPLTTDDWPFQKQYTYAMGAHCPDSGPGGAANCDPNYAGFSIQMAEAASLLRYYLDSMGQPWWPYKKLGNNNILYQNSKPECGSSNVNIVTKGTAALYTYTPYQPNQAALNNLYGTGDACSAYGNRNFWRTFNDWFGSAQTNIEYGWKYAGGDSYADIARTQPFTRGKSNITVAPGATAYIELKARNIGNRTWSKSIVRLGTSRPNDRCSSFAGNGWLSCNRIAMVEQNVLPGEIGTFVFPVTASQTTGTYREYFNLVAEGIAWLDDPGLYYEIDVVQPRSPANTGSTRLDAGQSLTPGNRFLSSDLHSVFYMQGDGNLVLYIDGKAFWTTHTSGYSISGLYMQGDGNLVLYGTDMHPNWSSGTGGNPGAYFVLQTDGNMVVYSSTNQPLWSSGTAGYPYGLNYVMRAMKSGPIFPVQELDSANGKYRLVFQSDGNLVLSSPNRVIWASWTMGKSATYFVIQGDGNVVLYNNANKPIWSSGTAGKGTSTLVMQDDGNLVLYGPNGNATWSSGTAGAL